jgi:hypothetical protein
MSESSSTAVDPQALVDDPSGRLAAYIARTQTPLDLLALVTLWIVVIQPGDFGGDASTAAVIVRVALSAIYGIDMVIRTVLAQRHWHYLREHLLYLAVVAVPPLRVVLSYRLVKSIFQRGHLIRFLLAATVLVPYSAP